MPLDRIVGCVLNGRKRGTTRLLRVGFGVSFAALAMCAQNSVARAGDYDDPSGQTFGSQVLKAIGLPDPDHPEYEINYSERSPLVVPPNRNLPPPISTNHEPAPNWPQDPDFKKRQATVKEQVHVEGDRVIDEGRPLRPDELMPKQTQASVAASSGVETPHKSFFSFDWFNKEEYGTFTGEPARANLTDPPVGYQTPSPDQPYGIPPERKNAKPQTLGERMEPVR
ncbi:MAG TPA: hypothetical protein VEK31_00965 [Xanthobacteraceae bacterium]|nr:hypothetical protein [Xanthobacteraceae bacterium]